MQSGKYWSILIFNPYFHLFSIEISVSFNTISLKIFSNDLEHWKKNYVEYNKNANGGYSVVWFKRNEEKRKIMDFGYCITAFLDDLKIILRHQKSVLNSFSVFFENGYNVVNVHEGLKQIFQNKDHFLKSQKLCMIVKDDNDVLPILCLMDPLELEIIEIHRLGIYEEDPMLLMDHLVEMDQWKNAEELRIEGYRLSNYYDHISHFKNVEISLKTITVELIVSLKNVS
ncbi:Protein CBG27230 [Caenorhabditis briggsae]|uniref:Protein CBG27230 n=1 Tax=Caenorhabditis briggsae TaxID=6238 RepID=B6IFV3_CAEBR|nr:Protein CBG27230 [Caenorhabditis briggsae]CAR98769.1 Protein CBG27230 [Caenorhabditis briggsae]